MIHKTFYFDHHKIKIFGQYWEPKNPKAVILLVHGMGEHSSRYEHSVVPQLVQNDVAIMSFDNFGHGKSGGKRGHTPGYEAMMELIDKLLEKVKKQFPSLPILLYGHSMGGNLVINYSLRKESNIVGVVATSPFLKLAFEPPAWKVIIGRVLQRIAPSVTLATGLEVNAISQDPEEVKKYIEAPLIHDRISPNFSFPVMDAGAWAIENAALLNLPMLILHGTKDRIVDYNGSVLFSNKTDKVDLQLIENGYHELHNDIEKQSVFAIINQWLNTKIKIDSAQ